MKLKDEEQTKPKARKMKEMINITARINERGNNTKTKIEKNQWNQKLLH